MAMSMIVSMIMTMIMTMPMTVPVFRIMAVPVSPMAMFVSPVAVSVSHTAVKKRVAVPMTFFTMRVSMSSVLEHKDADEVDEEPCNGHGQQAFMMHIWRF